MSQILNEAIAIIIGGAILGLLTFIAAQTWNIRKVWILDHKWQQEAADTLRAHNLKFEESNKNHELVMMKIGGLDGRVTAMEHPKPPVTRFKNPRVKAYD